MSLVACIARWKAEMKAGLVTNPHNGQPLSKSTVETYQSDVNQYARWLMGDPPGTPDLHDFNLPNIRAFLSYQKNEQGNRPRTQRGTLHALRNFGAWCVAQELLPSNPAQSIALPKKDAAVQVRIGDDQIADLLAACDRLNPERRSALARACIVALTYTGLRRQEVCDLQVDDLDLIGKRVVVRQGKGGKPRSVYPPEAFWTAMKLWLRHRGYCDHAYLLAYDRGRRVSYKGMKTILDDVSAAAGMRDADNVLPHAFRRAYATRKVANGASLQSLQADLGHANITTTALYIFGDEQRRQKESELGALEGKKPSPEPGKGDRRRAGWRRKG